MQRPEGPTAALSDCCVRLIGSFCRPVGACLLGAMPPGAMRPRPTALRPFGPRPRAPPANCFTASQRDPFGTSGLGPERRPANYFPASQRDIFGTLGLSVLGDSARCAGFCIIRITRLMIKPERLAVTSPGQSEAPPWVGEPKNVGALKGRNASSSAPSGLRRPGGALSSGAPPQAGECQAFSLQDQSYIRLTPSAGLCRILCAEVPALSK